jgi:hypothetical protein
VKHSYRVLRPSARKTLIECLAAPSPGCSSDPGGMASPMESGAPLPSSRHVPMTRQTMPTGAPSVFSARSKVAERVKANNHTHIAAKLQNRMPRRRRPKRLCLKITHISHILTQRRVKVDKGRSEQPDRADMSSNCSFHKLCASSFHGSIFSSQYQTYKIKPQ